MNRHPNTNPFNPLKSAPPLPSPLPFGERGGGGIELNAKTVSAFVLIQQFGSKMSFMDRIKDLARSHAVAHLKNLKLRILS